MVNEVGVGGGAGLELGAVAEAVRHDDVLVEVVGADGAVAFHLVDDLVHRDDRGGAVPIGRAEFGACLAGVAFTCIAAPLCKWV